MGEEGLRNSKLSVTEITLYIRRCLCRTRITKRVGTLPFFQLEGIHVGDSESEMYLLTM